MQYKFMQPAFDMHKYTDQQQGMVAVSDPQLSHILSMADYLPICGCYADDPCLRPPTEASTRAKEINLWV